MADSVKTLAWRYMVGGDPFPVDHDGAETTRHFLRRLDEVLIDLTEFNLRPPASPAQISDVMRAARLQDLTARKVFYRSDRIEDQQAWYSIRSAWNGRMRARWTSVAIIIEFCGLGVGVARGVKVFDIDVLGLLAAVGAGIAAWVLAKQYEQLNRSHFVASQELASIAVAIEEVQQEEDWSAFVASAEAAISREHSLWRASRGVTLRTASG